MEFSQNINNTWKSSWSVLQTVAPVTLPMPPPLNDRVTKTTAKPTAAAPASLTTAESQSLTAYIKKDRLFSAHIKTSNYFEKPFHRKRRYSALWLLYARIITVFSHSGLSTC